MQSLYSTHHNGSLGRDICMCQQTGQTKSLQGTPSSVEGIRIMYCNVGEDGVVVIVVVVAVDAADDDDDDDDDNNDSTLCKKKHRQYRCKAN